MQGMPRGRPRPVEVERNVAVSSGCPGGSGRSRPSRNWAGCRTPAASPLRSTRPCVPSPPRALATYKSSRPITSPRSKPCATLALLDREGETGGRASGNRVLDGAAWPAIPAATDSRSLRTRSDDVSALEQEDHRELRRRSPARITADRRRPWRLRGCGSGADQPAHRTRSSRSSA